MFDDKVLLCRDCGQNFEFTAGEQEFHFETGFTKEPGRCPECRAAKIARIRNRVGGYGGQERELFPAV